MSQELGARYEKLRKERGLSRREAADGSGITPGKLHRIEKKGIFKGDEKEQLDAFYAQDPEKRPVAASTASDVDHLRALYERMYALLPDDQRAGVHADATRGFPAETDFQASWAAASDEQRTHALTVIETACNKNTEQTPKELDPEAEPEGFEALTGWVKEQVNQAKQADPTGVGFKISDEGRAWRYVNDEWQREPSSDAVQLQDHHQAPGDRDAYHRWGELRQGSRVKLEGESGTFQFQAYVVPPNVGPAYADLWGTDGARTVSPERVLHSDGAPVVERSYARGVTEDGRVHAVPFTHWHLAGAADGPVKVRCGTFGVPDWDEPWSVKTLDPALCSRCVELTARA